jgi:lipoprotein-anchoring transpeptidase ErfK/SrfK
MNTRELLSLTIACVVTASSNAVAHDDFASSDRLTPDAVNDGTLTTILSQGMKGAAVLRAQVLLERAHFSPGELDASFGNNMRVAVIGFQKNHHLQPTGTIEEPTWAALDQDELPILVSYELSDADVDGDFEKIPQKMKKKAKMDAMGYTSPEEALGEKFHIRPDVLQQLNPGKDLEDEGEVIVVPDVEPSTPLGPVAKIVVSQSSSTVSLVDAAGRTIAQYPASTGSEHDPLPFGNWFVNLIAKNPTYHYDPKLFWDADSSDDKETLPPGPNNPVGVVWIDLSKKHYGIHGTPEPSNIGKTQSHGCIRMTNWSAWEVSQAVSPGTPVILQK